MKDKVKSYLMRNIGIASQEMTEGEKINSDKMIKTKNKKDRDRVIICMH
jgi:hypothetical protein